MDADRSEREQSILDYASAVADSLPECVPAAEAMIDKGAGPIDIVPHFDVAAHAVPYYARSLERRFSIESVPERCLLCGECAGAIMYVGYIIDIRPPAHLPTLKTQPASFMTHHRICESCGRGVRRTEAWFSAVETGSVWGFLLALYAAISGSSRAEAAEDVSTVRIVMLVLASVFVLLHFASRYLRRRQRPAALRRLEQRGVRISHLAVERSTASRP
jgi:hypothetical protein